MTTVRVQWSVRTQPLVAGAVVARGAAAADLGAALLARTDEELSALHGVASPSLLLVLGDADALPWAEGVEYLGRASGTSGLWLPVHARPSVPEELLERALVRGHGVQRLALLPACGAVIPLVEARRISREVLELWLAAERAHAVVAGGEAA